MPAQRCFAFLKLLVCGASALCASCSDDSSDPWRAPGTDGGDADSSGVEAGADGVHSDAVSSDTKADADVGVDAAPEAAPPCKTRITYGNAWMHGANPPAANRRPDPV